MVIVGLILTREAQGEIALHWMYMYHFTEFSDWSRAWDFFYELRTGISPIWALCDIFSYRTFGTLDLTALWLYRGCMIAMYVLPLWVFAKERWQVVVAFLAGVVCLWATVVIHPGNPQAYDTYMPALVLLLILLLQGIRDKPWFPALRLGACLLAGLLLSIIELTRPFVFLFMPIFLFSAWLQLREFPRKYFIVFLVPILLLSGGWHAKTLLLHGQLNWTNHTGFNFYQSWHEFIGYREFDESPREPGLSPNINTEWHYSTSKELLGLTFKSWIRHPWGATKHVALRTTQFFSAKTDLLVAKPQHWIFGPYRIVVWLLSLVFTITFVSFAWKLLRSRGKGLLQWMAQPEVLLLMFTGFNIAIFIVVEAREDARFLISVLPYLLSMPALQWVRKQWSLSRSTHQESPGQSANQ